MFRFPCVLTRENYLGWRTLRLSNGLVELFVQPELGGRIIQLCLGSHDFLYVNPRHRGRIYGPEENCPAAGWKNYGGSKVWPAPQGWLTRDQWPGPPDPVLDGGSYACRVVEESAATAALYLESQHDEYTGLTLAREIRIWADASTVEILHKMRNTSSRRVRWALWQVTQQDASRHLVVYARARRYRQMFGDKPFTQIELSREQGLWKLEYANQVAKFAVEAQEGWIVALKPQERVALVEEFRLFPGRDYPDGAPIEFWVNGEGTFTLPGGRIDMKADPNGCDPLIETEVLSPLAELAPNEEYTFPVTWHATTAAACGVAAVNPVALVSQPLSIRSVDGQMRVTGLYGLFQSGKLELTTFDRGGKQVGTLPLGEATPLAPYIIDETLGGDIEPAYLALSLKDAESGAVTTIERIPVRS
jgi:uncharacterized protein DUF4380